MKPGDRIRVVNCPWLEAFGIEGVVEGVDAEGIVADVTLDEPGIDNGKYRLDREGSIATMYLEVI